MKWLAFTLLLACVGCSTQTGYYNPYEMGQTGPVRPNAYGLGVNQDVYGRPHQYRTQNGWPVAPIFQNGVKRNGYGLGVHMDQFGRPVYDSTPGW